MVTTHLCIPSPDLSLPALHLPWMSVRPLKLNLSPTELVISHSNLFLLQSSPFHLVAPSPTWLLEPNTPNSSSILGFVLSISICIQTTNKSCPPVVCVSNLTARHSCFHHPSQSKPPALYPELRTLPPKQAPISPPLPSIPYIESTF